MPREELVAQFDHLVPETLSTILDLDQVLIPVAFRVTTMESRPRKRIVDSLRKLGDERNVLPEIFERIHDPSPENCFIESAKPEIGLVLYILIIA